MKIKLIVDDLIVDAICTRYGYDQKPEEEKQQTSKEDFFIEKVAEWAKNEAGSHVSAEAAAAASKTARIDIDSREVKKDK